MARVDLEGDGRGAVKAIQDLNKALAQTDKEFTETTKEAAKLEKQAKRVAELADPQKKYNRQIAELAQLVARGKLELSAAEIAAQRYQRRLDGAMRAGVRAFGSTAVGNLATFAAGFVGIHGAIRGVTAALREMETRGQSAADVIKSSIGSMGELAQLGDLKRDTKFARSLVERGVFAPSEEGQAAKVSFALQSASMSTEDKELIAQMGERRYVSPENLASLGGRLRKVQNVFKNENLPLEKILDRLIVASKKTQSSTSQIADAITELGSEARSAGATFDESLGAIVAIESESKDIAIAATRGKNMFARFDKAGMWKGSLSATVADIDRQVAGGKNVWGLMKNIRATAGYRNLSNQMGLFGQAVTDVAGSEGTFQRESFQYMEDPAMRQEIQRAKSQGRLYGMRQLPGEKERLMDELIAQRNIQQGDSFVNMLNTMTLKGFDWTGAENLSLREAARDKTLPQEFREDIVDYFRRTAEASERAAKAAEQKNLLPSGKQE